MKAKLLSFPFFSFHFFFGNGTFQRVTRKNKKDFSASNSRPRLSAEGRSAVLRTPVFAVASRVDGSMVSINRNPNIYFRNRKDFVDAIAFCASEAPIVSMI
jgi:hypothetical protein